MGGLASRERLTWHHELERRAEAAARAAARATDRLPRDGAENRPAAAVAPQLVPDTVLEMYGCKQLRAGVYEAVPGLPMCVVVLAELPRMRETLLLRLLGVGRLLAEALQDLDALPADA